MSAVTRRLRRVEKLALSAPASEDNPLVLLDILRETEHEIIAAQALVIDALRDAGHTWEAIGGALGVSKQAAWKRWTEAAPDVACEDPLQLTIESA